jgi:tetratricopeptide (TPR) repeat protein
MPSDPASYVFRGRAFLATGDFDRAISDLNRALELRPKLADALASRATVWVKKREFARALADLDLAISLDGENIQTYYARASVHEAKGNHDRAVADLSKAIELKPRTVFDTMAQDHAKKRVQVLTKRTPCGSAGEANGAQSCL